jgi:1-phosphofructokinase
VGSHDDKFATSRITRGGEQLIVTVTLNPSVDRTIEVDVLSRGAVIRATAEHVDAGGKGINVTRALAAHGGKSRAVLPVGGSEGRQLVAMLASEGVEIVEVPVRASARCNIAVSEPDGTVTKINSLGHPLSAEETAEVAAAVLASVSEASWFVAGGSLPFGVPDTFYADLVERLRPAGVPVAVDTSGAPLAHAVAAGPALVKPNREELEAAVGRPLRTLGEVLAAAQELRGRGAGTVLASLGADGAVLVAADGAWHGEAPAVARSAVGAGDAMLAGFLHGGAAGPAALTSALAWGAAATSLPGSRMPRPEDLRVDLVTVHPEIVEDRPLH